MNIRAKKIAGAVNRTLSKRSSTPPCPGMILPKSLMSWFLLIADAAKSPICEITDPMAQAAVQLIKGFSSSVIRIPKISAYMAPSKAETELVLTAVVGMIGIEPTLAAIAAGKDIALANKESLCCAGHLIMPAAREKGVKILPVDSEHSAIFQCLQGNGGNKIRRLLLTASGGPFRGYTKEQLAKVSPAQALRHPNWAMGKKITIDSSTMANKGLELMEARWLFDVAPENIEVVVQPQSVIHSMVEYEDGSVLAQLGTPDMRLPIQYALYYPERRFLEGERLDFFKLKNLHFEEADTEVFEALALARRAICCGGSMPTVFNAANEYAVALFLEEKIQYPDICRLIRTAMDRHRNIPTPSLQDILHTKEEVEACLSECL